MSSQTLFELPDLRFTKILSEDPLIYKAIYTGSNTCPYCHQTQRLILTVC